MVRAGLELIFRITNDGAPVAQRQGPVGTLAHIRAPRTRDPLGLGVALNTLDERAAFHILVSGIYNTPGYPITPRLRLPRMQSQRQDPGVELEVLISRKDRERSAGSDRANEKIDTRALDTGRAAAVGEGSSLLIVAGTELDVGKGAQMLPERVELVGSTHAGKELLANRPHDESPSVMNQIREHGDQGRGRGVPFTP